MAGNSESYWPFSLNRTILTERKQRDARSLFRDSTRRNRYFLAILRDRTAEDAGIAEVHFQLRRTGQSALNKSIRQRILDVLLQRPAKRTRAISAIAVLLEHVARSLVRQPNFDLL